ncbi:MAG: zinc metallopeptidase [Clostridium sp.]|nr:zinc metallopeptidase [Clostridium sp.]
MELLIILIIIIITQIILKIVLKTNKKEIMKIAENESLNARTQELPNNVVICKEILKKLNNEKVKVEEEERTNCFYFIATDKIILNKDKKFFTRIQTIAHECVHSIQNKNVLWFNYIFTNLLNLFWLVITILTVVGVIKNYILFVSIMLILAMVFYVIIEAMTKAKYIAKEYLEEHNVKETKKITEEYEKINNIGIKYTCYKLISSKLYLIILYIIICLIKLL